MIEIEVKARIRAEEQERILADLVKLCGAPTEINKEDHYYRFIDRNGAVAHFRLRRERGRCVASVKEREVRDGVEINVEHEVAIRAADVDSLRAMVRLIGGAVECVKRKVGYAYTYNGMTIEVVTVAPLGIFVEIERLLPPERADDRDRDIASKEVRDMLARLGIPPARIEERRYIDLLRDV